MEKLLETEIDERGRVKIPRELRDMLNLRPAQKLKVEARGRELILRAVLDPEQFIKEMKGCVAGANIKPEGLKEIWNAKHANH